MRTLHLTNPRMHGSDVNSAQTLLASKGFLEESDIDGVFGDKTALACEKAKFRYGYPSVDIKPSYGDVLNGYLKGKPLPADYKVRVVARQGETFAEFEQLAIRHKIVAIAQWGVHNTHDIHYQQRRPIDGTNHPYQLPLYTDCSGFVTLCYEWAGAPDPNGRGFDGLGYTGTLLQHMKHIQGNLAKIADLCVFGAYPGRHVVVAVGGPHSNPSVISHGKEGDPVLTTFASERLPGEIVTWLTLPTWGLPKIMTF